MSIPASIAISKIVYPEDEVPVTLGRVVVDRGAEDNAEEGNLLHAFSNGAWFGLKVAGLILCNVLVVLALLYVIDGYTHLACVSIQGCSADDPLALPPPAS
jgi:CNT family concentrative nucleoside transporter